MILADEYDKFNTSDEVSFKLFEGRNKIDKISYIKLIKVYSRRKFTFYILIS